MKNNLLIDICLLLSVIQYSGSVTICSENEESKTEANCETTCTIKGLAELEGLVPKCVCINGFARTDDGICVEAENCNCGVNEILVIKEYEKCKTLCTCKEGFHRQGVNCVKKCENNNQENCHEYDLNECKCLKCDPAYRKCNEVCHKDDPECAIYDDECQCENCTENYRLCKNTNTCVKLCENSRTYNEKTCRCDCPDDTELCGDKCMKTSICKKNQYFSTQSCKCVCDGGFYPCQDVCHKIITYCEVYDNESCMCNKCSPGYKVCNNTCISATCGRDQYFSTDKCSCVCSGGFYKCQGSCHLVQSHCEHYNKYTCKCNDCSPGFSLCKNICVESACGKHEIFIEDQCSCQCRSGFRKCQDMCHPILPDCISYSKETCKCIKCSPGFLLHGSCISTNCGKNEFFAKSILQCACKKGYMKNNKGICQEIRKSLNWFTQLIFGFKGLCRINEVYKSCPSKTERTCQGTRMPQLKQRCFCKRDYIRDKKSMLCVKVCPLPGAINETFECLQFGPEKLPPLTDGADIQKYLENKNEVGYRCIDGYIRVDDKCKPILHQEN